MKFARCKEEFYYSFLGHNVPSKNKALIGEFILQYQQKILILEETSKLGPPFFSKCQKLIETQKSNCPL